MRYGHKWTSAFEGDGLLELAVSEWGNGLSGYSPEQIRHGLEHWQGAWPPSLVEFQDACIPSLESLGIDFHRDIVEEIAGDEWNFSRMSAEKSYSQYNRVKARMESDMRKKLMRSPLQAQELMANPMLENNGEHAAQHKKRIGLGERLGLFGPRSKPLAN